MSALDDVLKFTGRLALAAIFLWAAWGKVNNPSGTISHIQSAGIPAPGLAFVLAVAIESVCGLCVAIGWRVRYAAFALFLFLIPATYFFHFDLSSRIQVIMALKNAAIMGGLLILAAAGPGRISVDKS